MSKSKHDKNSKKRQPQKGDSAMVRISGKAYRHLMKTAKSHTLEARKMDKAAPRVTVADVVDGLVNFA